MLKSFRYLLFPFSLLYGFGVWLRNKLYDWKILKSATFNFPIICVGNLAVGGTGKTPMTEFLIEELKHRWVTATLSRGYKRKTKGFAIASERTTALEIGDEPMQFHRKFPDITVAVGEERLVAIPQILHSKPGTQVIILDDAFQHRAVNAGLNIVLTEYRNLYTRDHMMPTGDLRDVVSSANRAQVIVVTKCPGSMTTAEKEKIREELDPGPDQRLFFTETVYGDPYHLFTGNKGEINTASDILLLCGIANPEPLKEYLEINTHSFDMLRYPDHHIFTMDDLKDILAYFKKSETSDSMLVTTEKDAVRLEKFRVELENFPIYVLPVKHRFLFEQGGEFTGIIHRFIESFHIGEGDKLL